LAANRPKASGREEEKKGSKIGDPKFINIKFDDGSLSGKEDYICAIYSCWHKAHQGSLEANGAVEGGWC
jgi:hypothetical protein